MKMFFELELELERFEAILALKDAGEMIAAFDALSEDDQKIWSDEIQELTNVSIKKIDEVLEQKQMEIMQV